MSKTPKPVPTFASEAEERTHLPNLKPFSTAISSRPPNGLLERIKVAANKRDVPYQSLIKTWLAEKIDASRHRATPASGRNCIVRYCEAIVAGAGGKLGFDIGQFMALVLKIGGKGEGFADPGLV